LIGTRVQLGNGVTSWRAAKADRAALPIDMKAYFDVATGEAALVRRLVRRHAREPTASAVAISVRKVEIA